MSRNFDQYWVFYSRGLMGTWLSWFINQHEEFPRFTDLERWENGEHHTFDGCWWLHDDPEEEGVQNTSTYQEHIDAFEKMKRRKNENWTKLCSKILPDHGATISDEEYLSYLKPIKTKGIIVPYIFDKNYGIIDLRNQVHGFHEPWHKWLTEDMYRFEKHQHAPVHYIDCGNLLDSNESEYNKLLEFIEQPPLDSWKKECELALAHIKKSLVI